MDIPKLKKHISDYKKYTEAEPEKFVEDGAERHARSAFYRGWTRERINAMSEED